MPNHRSLTLIKNSGSTSRILNLHLVHENHQKSEEFIAQPLFENPRLNRSMLVKHAMRSSEKYLFEKPRSNGTKIMLPLANDDLGIGAINIFIGQKNFRGALNDIVGGYQQSAALEKDAELLQALDALPSMDPFLLRERLKQIGRNVARCYFQISDSDLAKMQSFVGSEIQRLVEKAFQGGAESQSAASLSGQMASKILSDENTETLAPLKLNLGMNGNEWTEGVFSWKGFLYYKWCFSGRLSTAARTVAEMQTISLARCNAASAQDIRRLRERAATIIRTKLKAIAGLLQFYDDAFKAMTDEGKPGAFRDFLLASPAMFLEIGEHMGVISHISSFWDFKFRMTKDAALEGPELLEVFQEIDSCSIAESGMNSTEMKW